MSVLDSIHQTAIESSGGITALAARMGTTKQVLSSKLNQNNTTHHLRLDEFEKLMAFTGDYRALHALAEDHGFILVPMPEVYEETPAEELVHAIKESSEYIQTVAEALADGKVTVIELRQCEKEKAEMMEAAAILQEVLRKMSKE